MDINELVEAIQTLNAEDAFRSRLTADHWNTVALYLTRHEHRAGDVLIRQGELDRVMYFLAKGSLQVFALGDAPGRNRIAILRAGSVVGEPSLFGESPRMASVEAITACVIYALRGPRLEEMAQRSPLPAFELLRAAGGVMAIRMRATLAKQIPFS